MGARGKPNFYLEEHAASVCSSNKHEEVRNGSRLGLLPFFGASNRRGNNLRFGEAYSALASGTSPGALSRFAECVTQPVEINTLFASKSCMVPEALNWSPS